MELGDLTHIEQLALLGLVQFIGESNRDVSDEESEAIAGIVAALGAERYRKVAAEADERFADEESLRNYLQTNGRPEARELIYGHVLELAMGDTIQASESELLDWLAEEWGIQVQFEDGEGA
jgi:hypothetical protein